MTAAVAALAMVALVLLAAGGAPRRLPPTPTAGAPGQRVADRAADLLQRAVPSRRRRRADQQLPDALDRLASALRAGQAIGPALVALAEDLPDPLGTDLRAVTASIERGAPAGDAVARWAGSDAATPDVGLVAAALTIGARAGGEVARAIDGVAATLRERHELRGELRALATQARASAGVLAVAPVAFAALVASIDPRAIHFLVATPVGLACLVAGVGLDAVGVVWMARITRSAA